MSKAIITKGLCDAGASGPATRWARLPVGINGKGKYRNGNGQPFQCRSVKWHPEVRYSPEEIISGLKLELTEKKEVAPRRIADDVFIPGVDENPVITELKNRGLYKKVLGSGKHDITCPWKHEHTDVFLAFEQRCHDDPRTLGSLFYACSEEQQDLNLVEAMQRLLSLALDKVRAAGIIAENAVLAIVDAVMGFAIDILQTGKRLTHITNLITET